MLGLHIRNDVSEYAFKNSYKISRIIIHDKYNESTSENDIAILKLNKQAMLNVNVSIICLPITKTDVYLNRTASITGWGLSNNINNTNSQIKLQQTTVTLIKNDEKRCEMHLNKYNKNSMFCAINAEEHSNACSGDSGI